MYNFQNGQFRIIEKTEEVELLTKEYYWTKKIWSVYPFALNDQITWVGIITRQNLIDSNLIDSYFIYLENRYPRIHGNSNKNESNKYKINNNTDEIISNLKYIYN